MWNAWERAGRVKEGLECQGKALRVQKMFDWGWTHAAVFSCSVSLSVHPAGMLHTMCQTLW